MSKWVVEPAGKDRSTRNGKLILLMLWSGRKEACVCLYMCVCVSMRAGAHSVGSPGVILSWLMLVQELNLGPLK